MQISYSHIKKQHLELDKTVCGNNISISYIIMEMESFELEVFNYGSPVHVTHSFRLLEAMPVERR